MLEKIPIYLDQSKLSQMIPMIRRINNIRILQFPQISQLFHDPMDGGIDRLQRLQPFGHQQVSEFSVYGQHLLGDLQYPLLVWVRREVVRWSTENTTFASSVYV